MSNAARRPTALSFSLHLTSLWLVQVEVYLDIW